MASRVESAVKRAFGVDAHCAPNDDAIRKVEAERYAVLAELRELEDCMLILRYIHREFPRLYQELQSRNAPSPLVIAVGRPLDPLTDEQRAALVKACGET